MAFSIIKFLILLFINGFCLLILFADEKEVYLTPGQTVSKWTQIYGIDMDRASDITTLYFRHGLTKKDWAARYAPILNAIGYEHLGGEIIEELTKNSKSMVVMHAKIMTVAGGMSQVEIYELLKIDGTWLINNISVKEETEFGKSNLDEEI